MDRAFSMKNTQLSTLMKLTPGLEFTVIKLLLYLSGTLT